MDPTVTRRGATTEALAAGTALAAFVVALVLAGGQPQPVPAGLADSGPVVGWGLRICGLGGLLASVVTVGSLMTVAVLRPGDPQLRRRVMRWAAHAGWVWAATVAAGAVLAVADAAGVGLTGLDSALLQGWGSTDQTVAALATASAAGLVSASALRVRSLTAARILLAVALAASLPTAVAGHGVSGGTTDAVVVHVVAALVWTGGLAGIVLHLRGDRMALAAAVPRFSVIALGAFGALGASGLLAVYQHTLAEAGSVREVWATGYIGLVAAKVALLVTLGVIGHQHRRRSLPRLMAGAPCAFLRLASTELVVMAAALGLGAALARTPLPPASTDPVAHASSHGALPELSLTSLALTWRPDAVVLTVVGVALAAYLDAVRRLRRSGIDWPRRRTASLVGGLAVTLVALGSGIAAYAPALLSIHLTQLLLMLLVVPPLVLLGQPLTLARSIGGSGLPDGLLRVLSNPATGAVATCVLLTVLTRTSLISVSLSSPWVHLAVVSATTCCGVALLWPALGPDTLPRQRSHTERAGWLLVVALVLALLGAQLRWGDQLLAAEWFLELRLGWVDPTVDQRHAGTVALLAATALAAFSLTPDRTLSRWSPQRGHTRISTTPTRSADATAP